MDLRSGCLAGDGRGARHARAGCALPCCDSAPDNCPEEPSGGLCGCTVCGEWHIEEAPAPIPLPFTLPSIPRWPNPLQVIEQHRFFSFRGRSEKENAQTGDRQEITQPPHKMKHGYILFRHLHPLPHVERVPCAKAIAATWSGCIRPGATREGDGQRTTISLETTGGPGVEERLGSAAHPRYCCRALLRRGFAPSKAYPVRLSATVPCTYTPQLNAN